MTARTVSPLPGWQSPPVFRLLRPTDTSPNMVDKGGGGQHPPGTGAPSMATAALQMPAAGSKSGARAAAAARLDPALWAERESLILWLPVAFGAGIAAWFVLPGPAAWSGFMLAMAAAMLVAVALGAADYLGPRALLIASLAAALGCATIWWKSERVAAPVLGRPVVTRFVATVEFSETLAAREAIRADAAARTRRRAATARPRFTQARCARRRCDPVG